MDWLQPHRITLIGAVSCQPTHELQLHALRSRFLETNRHRFRMLNKVLLSHQDQKSEWDGDDKRGKLSLLVSAVCYIVFESFYQLFTSLSRGFHSPVYYDMLMSLP